MTSSAKFKRWFQIGLPALTAVLLFGLLLSIFLFSQFQSSIDLYEQERLSNWINSERAATHYKREIAAMAYRRILADPDSLALVEQAALQTDPRELAAIRQMLYERHRPLFEALSSGGMSQMQFQLPDGTSLLRMHAAEKHGDSVIDYRPSVLIVNSTRIPYEGFEEGRDFCGYRFVFPLIHESRHLGSIDLGFSPESWREFLTQTMGGWHNFALRADAVRELSELDFRRTLRASEFLPGYLVSTEGYRPGRELFQILPEEERREALATVRLTLAELAERGYPAIESFAAGGRDWDAMVYPLKNFRGVVVGQLYSIQPNNLIALMRRQLYKDLAGAWLSVLLLVGLFTASYWQRQRLFVEQTGLVRRLENMGRTIPGAIYQFQYWPSSGRMVFPYASEGVEKIYGLTRQQLREDASGLFDHVHPDDIAAVRASMEASAASLSPWHCEYRVLTPEDGLDWYELRAIPQARADDSVLWHGFLTNIAQRKAAETALAESEQKFRALFQSAPFGMAMNDLATGRWSEFNDAILQGTGYSREEFGKLTYLDLTPEEYAQQEVDQLRMVRENGVYGPYEKEFIRKDGTRYPVVLNGFYFKDSSGREGVWSLIQDISESKKMEQELRQSEERFRDMAEAAGEYLWEVDRAGKFQFVSPEAERLFGRRMDTILGQPLISFIPELHHAQQAPIFNSIFENRSAFREVEYCAEQPDGKLTWQRCSGTPFENEAGEWAGFRGTAVDITREKEARDAAEQSQKRLQIATEAGKIGVWEYLVARDELVWDERMLAMFSLKDDGFGGRLADFKRAIVPQDKKTVEAKFQRFLEGRDDFSVEFRIRTGRGATRHISASATVVRDQEWQPVRVVGVALDITERKSAEQALAKSELIMRAFVEHAPAAVAMFDTHMRYIAHSRKWLTDYDLVGRDIIGCLHYEVFPEIKEDWKAVHQRCLRGEVIKNEEEIFLREHGTKQWLSWEVRPWFTAHGSIGGLIMLTSDVTERKNSEDALRRTNEQLQEAIARANDLANRDPLTGLHNRTSLRHNLEGAITSTAAGQAACLLYIDLDNFKTVNDTQGHSAGDEVLREVAGILAGQFSSGEMLCRFGGDEFVAISRRGEAESVALAERIVHEIKNHLFRDGERLYAIGASVGVCVLEPEMEREEAISRADEACYSAKRKGRNGVEVFRHDESTVRQLLSSGNWSRRIGEAISEERFELWFQPIVDLQEGRPFFYETLLRLRERDGTIIEPSDFISPAERFHLMPELDEYVMKRAAQILISAPQLKLSINLSAQILGRTDFLDIVKRHFPADQITPSRVVWEVTETEALANLYEAGVQTAGLRDLGFLVALDDFGSGFSSFDYLRRLKVDFLKIDGLIVRGILDDPANLAFTKAIRDIAQSMKLECIAEFVETEAVENELRGMGVKYGQGYRFARPRPDYRDLL